MRLVSLSANQPSFRSVIFRPQGLSLVVAEQKSLSTSQTTTYNGVGKTLMLELLHYCLGSNKRVAFERHLKGWVFSLAVDVDGEVHTITRSADKPGEIGLDGVEINLPQLNEFLGSASLEVAGKIPSISFRSIIPRFIRSGRSAYVEFKYAGDGESKEPYEAMLRTSLLLGLDLELAQKKHRLRNRKQKLKDTMKQLEQDPLFAALLAQDTVDIELIALKEQANRLQRDLVDFRVADDYHEIEREANGIKRELESCRREEVKLSEAIAQVDRSLVTKGDLPAETVFQLYEEAQAALPQAVRRRIEEVVSFQRDLQRKRVYRLSLERQRLARALDKQENEVRDVSRKLDEKMRYLSEHRALDEYVAVSAELSQLQQRIAQLERSSALREAVDHELKRIDLDLAEENIRTDNYLHGASALIGEATALFRLLARELYGSRPSGLSIANDSGDNQQRYRIDAHITADAAEGINEAKIFCFDVVVLSLRRGHKIQFLAHDSTLFGPVDPRQRLAMLRIADRISRDLGTQYIATLNVHDITSIREQVSVEEGELESIFGEQSVVLRLTDGSAEEKLLGIEVDMDYTK